MKYTLAFALPVIIFCSCGRDVDCADTSINPEFSGYTLNDVDTMILRRYKAGDGFNTLIDTVLLTYSNSVYESVGNGDLKVLLNLNSFRNNGGPKTGIQVGYDWKLYIPTSNKTVAITGIASEHNSTHCWKCVCYNRIFSCVVDTVTYKFTDTSSYTFHVRR